MQIYIKFPNYTQTHEIFSTPHLFGKLPYSRVATDKEDVTFYLIKVTVPMPDLRSPWMSSRNHL